MQSWQDDQLQSLTSAKSEQALFGALTKLVRDEGFDVCSYGIRPPVPVSNPRIFVFDNFPKAWHQRYHSQRYVEIDPTVKHGLRSMMPLVWTDEVFSSAQHFWEDARSQGLRYGWAQPCRDPCGVAGMLTVARDQEALSDKELKAKVPRLLWLTQVAHQSMSRLVMPRAVPEAQCQFTAREIAVMRWTAEGKTSSDIAGILRISTRTVNFHVQNVITKLSVSNKTAAAIRLAVLGLLG